MPETESDGSMKPLAGYGVPRIQTDSEATERTGESMFRKITAALAALFATAAALVGLSSSPASAFILDPELTIESVRSDGGGHYDLKITSKSTGRISTSSGSPSVCSVVGDSIWAHSAGWCVVNVTQKNAGIYRADSTSGTYYVTP